MKSPISLRKRRNAKLYPIYKMFSWDLLFFYSIEFLFYTITKKVTPSEVLIINACYMLFKVIMQIPSIMMIDFIGKKKSIVTGNFLLIIYMLILIYSNKALDIIVADFFCAWGYCIKAMSEGNLLYDSVSTKGGDGLYSKIDTKGGTLYYTLDGIAAMVSGYLFVINNYIPIYICLAFIILSTILSLGFKEVYKVKRKKINKKNRHELIREYKDDIRVSFRFILRSNRMRALMLFTLVFYSFIKSIDIYRSDLLVDIGIPEQQFSMIFAIFTLIGGAGLTLRRPIEKKFKNKTLTVISLTYIVACISVGTISGLWKGNSIIIPIVLMMYTLQRVCTSIWWVLEAKYTKNFTTVETRNKLTFSYEFIKCIAASIVSIMAGLLLKIVTIENAFIIIGVIALILMIFVLKYMKTRLGLKPRQYTKRDLELETIER